MNRNAEYEQLMQDLASIPVPNDGIKRAIRRRRLICCFLQPLSSIAAIFVLFVILVNASTTVAYACSHVPGLRDLAAAVTFSRSLSDAVSNDYVQPVSQQQTKDGVTVKIEYLIVDQKNVNVFYRLESAQYTRLEAIPEFTAADGSSLGSCACWANDWDTPNGELRSIHLEFLDADVPSSLKLQFSLRSLSAADTAAEPANGGKDGTPEEFEPVAEFEFLLEYDPECTAQGKHFETDARIVLGDQTLHLTNVDVYPSYMSFSLRGDPSNTAWLASLRFYLVTDRGERFDPVSSGITATGNPDTPEMTTFRADSAFFYGAKAVTLYVTGAEWLDKEQNSVHIDLANACADFMPEGTELVSSEHRDGGWVVTVLQENTAAQAFMPDYRDAHGQHYSFDSWTSGAGMLNGITPPEGYTFNSFPLNDYPYDEVWLTPRYTRRWSAQQPEEAEIRLD